MLTDLRKPKPQINQREEEGSFTWKEARALEGFLKASNEALEGFIKVEEGALRDTTNWQVFHSTKMGGIIENTPTTPKIFTRVHFFSLFVFFLILVTDFEFQICVKGGTRLAVNYATGSWAFDNVA